MEKRCDLECGGPEPTEGFDPPKPFVKGRGGVFSRPTDVLRSWAFSPFFGVFRIGSGFSNGRTQKRVQRKDFVSRFATKEMSKDA